MSGSSSSSSNDSLLHEVGSSISSNLFFGVECFLSSEGSLIFTTYNLTNILLLLPLCIFILYHGFQQWRTKRSSSSAAAMSHSDSFTYHMVTMELVGVFGCILCLRGVFSGHVNVLIVGAVLYSYTWFGQVFFHVLTCVERYLAVVHPITYLSLRKERGIRIRNVSIVCATLLSIIGTILVMIDNFFLFVDFCVSILSLAVTAFCSLSVLCVLIRPGPGEQGGGRERVDQSKQRAFYTILAILGVLVVRFSWSLIRSVLNVSGRDHDCVMRASEHWINLPSSLVLPLLFLHRAGKLMFWKNNIRRASGQNMQK